MTIRSGIRGLGLTLLALATCLTEVGGAAEPAPAKAGQGPAYDELGRLVLMHSGRRKPLDTVARQEVKIINGRQSFELEDDAGVPIGKWDATAAFWGWSSDRDTWDDRRFILVEYVPLKEYLMGGRARALAAAILADDNPSADLAATLKAMVEADRVSGADLRALARSGELSEKRQGEVEALAHRLDGGDKFCSPRELEEASIRLDGRTIDFEQWFRDCAMKSRPMANPGGTPPKLTAIEDKVVEVHGRLVRYQLIRGDRDLEFLPAVDRMVPRPANEAYLGFLAATLKKYDDLKAKPENADKEFPLLDRARLDRMDNIVKVETASGRDFPIDGLERLLAMEEFGFTRMEADAIGTIVRHWADLPREDRKVPGTESAADELLINWLREDADWAPISLLVDSQPADLSAAGYPGTEVGRLRDAYQAAREAEVDASGGLPTEAATSLVAAARDLAESVSGYPSVGLVDQEVGYNRFAPFYKAPIFYGLGALLLGLSLSFRPTRGTALDALRKAMVGVGMAGFVGGIGLEVYGFAQRVAISGWAPVTNMYETVIWVALVTASIGLVLELIYRKVYAAAAASAVATLCTIIAANAASVLNPNIESLQPVLRSNYWLTIHVLTIVSSYAAFALAMGLGTIALWSYLTATYRRDVTYGELAAPLIMGGPALAGGLILAYAPTLGLKLDESAANLAFYAGWGVATLGILGVVMTLTGWVGEAISRAAFARFAARPAEAPPAAEAPAEDAGRSKFAAGRVELSPRERSMQETAGRIKPIVAFVYRALQVGVLLVAAGTILGGVWADYSWGRFWGWDPKEVSALITLLAYLVPLHGRFAGWINSFGLVCASVFCFNFVLLAWYGVNFLLGVGLHSYGFAEGGSQGTVLLSAWLLNCFMFGTVWRRFLARQGAAPKAEAASA